MIYELKAGGVDERRLVGAKLEKLAEGETGTLNRATKFFVIQNCCIWRIQKQTIAYR